MNSERDPNRSPAEDIFDEDEKDFWNPPSEEGGSSLSRLPPPNTQHGVNAMVSAAESKREIARLAASHRKPASKAKSAQAARAAKAKPAKKATKAKPAKKASKAAKAKPAKKASKTKTKSRRAA